MKIFKIECKKTALKYLYGLYHSDFKMILAIIGLCRCTIYTINSSLTKKFQNSIISYDQLNLSINGYNAVLFTEEPLRTSISSISIDGINPSPSFDYGNHALMLVGSNCIVSFNAPTKVIVYFVSSNCKYGVYSIGGKENMITFDHTYFGYEGICAFIPSFGEKTTAKYKYGKVDERYGFYTLYNVDDDKEVETTSMDNSYHSQGGDIYGLFNVQKGRYYFKRERISSEPKFLSGCVPGDNVRKCSVSGCEFSSSVRITYGSCSTSPDFVLIAVIIVVVVVIIIVAIVVLGCLGVFAFICGYHKSNVSDADKEPVYQEPIDQPAQCYQQQTYYQPPPVYQQPEQKY